MTDNNNYRERVNRKNYAMIGLPMTLLIMIIVSGVIISMYVLGSDYVVSFHQEKQVKNVISNVCEKVSLMNLFSPSDSRITMSLSFPSLVDTIVFGCDSFEPYDDSNISYHRRCCVLIQLTNDKQEIIHCPVAFCDEQQRPLLFHSGTYQISFSIKEIDGEVVAVGSMA